MTITDRREQERVRRKQDILQAARAILAQDGFGRATVEAVAQRAEVGKGTIYLYFESKEAILAELVLEALRELSSRLEATGEGRSVLHPEQRLRALAEAYFNFAQQAPDYFRLINAFDHDGFQKDISPLRQSQILAESMRALEPVTEAIADGMALGIFAAGDARQTASVLWAALNGALTLLLHPIRRTVLATDEPGLYHATLELLLRGLMCGHSTLRQAKDP